MLIVRRSAEASFILSPTTMHLRHVAALLLLVRLSLGQSGDSSETSDDEVPLSDAMMNFTCFSKLRLEQSTLYCNITEWPSEDTSDIYFRLCVAERCESKMEFQHFTIRSMVRDHNVCMMGNKIKACRDYDIKKIVIPDRPTSLSIKYNNESEEYDFHIDVPYKTYKGVQEYLMGKLIHEVVLRKKGDEWPDCEREETDGPLKRCYKSSDIRIPKRYLDYSTEYEAKARSKPNGDYFDGSWSLWCDTVSFITEADSDLFLVIVISLVALFMLLVAMMIIKCFWKSRIKPVIWPEIPDHKLALDKLCKKPQQFMQLSFSPDYFDSMPINKVDYIRALERAEDNFQISAGETPMKKPLDKSITCNTAMSPAVGSKGWSTNVSDPGKWNDGSGHVAVEGMYGDNLDENPKNPENISSLSGPHSHKCAVSNGDLAAPGVAILQNLPIYSNALKQPDDAFNFYIAMSAFKTPATVGNPIFNM